jgi:hypothetical protein
VNSIKPLGYNSREAFFISHSRKKTMNNRRTVFIALIFLATIVACVVPGLPTASAPVPAPTVDTGRIETMVAGTVSAAIAQTEQAQPTVTNTLRSTSTTSPSSTPVPPTVAVTSTVNSTAAPTGTVMATISPSQSALTKQADGSMLFADERAGYELKLPLGWLSVRINEQEYLDAFSLEESANTNIQQSLLSVQKEDPNVFRLLAIDTKAAHIQNDFVTDMRFVLNEKKAISLSSDADLQAIARDISASATVFRFEVTSVKIITSTNGTQFGVIEAKSSFTNASGADVTIYQKQVFFNVKTGTQSISFTTVDGLKEILMPAFDAMLETIKAK